MTPRTYVVLERRYPRKGTQEKVAITMVAEVGGLLEAKEHLRRRCRGHRSYIFKTGRAARYVKNGELYRVYIKRRRGYQ